MFYMFDVIVESGDKNSLIFAEYNWLREHPYQKEFGEFIQICNTDFEGFNEFKLFVPVTFFMRKFCCVKTTQEFKPNHQRRYLQKEPINFIIPLSSKSL